MSQIGIYKILTVIAGCSLALVTWQSVNAEIPKPWAPFSIIHVILGLWTSSKLLVFSWGTIAFWIWNPNAFSGQPYVPKRSIVLYVALAALSIWYNVEGISYGMRYQGKEHTIIVVSINISLLLLMAGVLICSQRKHDFTRGLLFHWLLFAWLLSYAFPYLGEMP